MSGTHPYGHPLLVVTGCVFPGCNAFPAEPCAYPLGGEKEGEPCGRCVCAEHAVVADGRRLCPSHGRLVASGGDLP